MKSVGAYIWRSVLNFDLCKFVRAVWFVFLSGFADMLAFCVKFGKFNRVIAVCKSCIAVSARKI